MAVIKFNSKSKNKPIGMKNNRYLREKRQYKTALIISLIINISLTALLLLK